MCRTGRDLVTQAGPCGEPSECFNKGPNERLFICAARLALAARLAAAWPGSRLTAAGLGAMEIKHLTRPTVTAPTSPPHARLKTPFWEIDF